MRVRLTKTDIIEVTNVFVTPAGKEDKNNPGKYKEMMCKITLKNDYGYDLMGEFNCDGATTFKECEEKAYKFIDELYQNGCIDISTEEKCKEYGITIW